MKDKKICCICENEFEGWGNNPWPVKETGECCDSCDSFVVIPYRLKIQYNNYIKELKEVVKNGKEK